MRETKKKVLEKFSIPKTIDYIYNIIINGKTNN